jgi:hypothetical protein
MRASILAILLSTCQAYTTRPGFAPVPEAATGEVRLEVPAATKALADALRADSIPVARVVERDGVVESSWFEVPGFKATTMRPLGPSVVRVRGWVDVGRSGHSLYTVEAIYRVYADPSRPSRELEASLPEGHPAQVHVHSAMRKLLQQYGSPEDVKADSIAQRLRQAQLRKPEAAKPDTTKPEAAKADTTKPAPAKPDTTRPAPAKPDTTRPRRT